jgi:hypothetical protein
VTGQAPAQSESKNKTCLFFAFIGRRHFYVRRLGKAIEMLAPNRVAQRRLNPYFLRAVRASDLPNYQIALLAGFRHPQRFSSLLHATVVPDTTRTQFEAVAKLVDFPPDQIFLESEAAR